MWFKTLCGLAVIAAVAACQFPQASNCDTSLNSLQKQTSALVQAGKRKQAQDMVAGASECLGDTSGYWVTRAQLLLSDTASRGDALKAADYLGKATDIAPEKTYLSVQRAGILFNIDEVDQGNQLYENALATGAKIKQSKPFAAQLFNSLLGFSPLYVEKNKADHADQVREHIFPFLARICDDQPALKSKYEKVIVGVVSRLVSDGGTARSIDQACTVVVGSSWI